MDGCAAGEKQSVTPPYSPPPMDGFHAALTPQGIGLVSSWGKGVYSSLCITADVLGWFSLSIYYDFCLLVSSPSLSHQPFTF